MLCGRVRRHRHFAGRWRLAKDHVSNAVAAGLRAVKRLQNRCSGKQTLSLFGEASLRPYLHLSQACLVKLRLFFSEPVKNLASHRRLELKNDGFSAPPKNALFFNFPHVCPEPVLVNGSFFSVLMIKWHRKLRFLTWERVECRIALDVAAGTDRECSRLGGAVHVPAAP